MCLTQDGVCWGVSYRGWVCLTKDGVCLTEDGCVLTEVGVS